MSYESARRHEIRSHNIRLANELIEKHDPDKKTIILLPGGMGSRLKGSKKVFRENNPGPFEYDTVWIDLGLIFKKDALKLEIDKNNHDKNDRIIIADGPFKFFLEPYDGTKQFFKDRGYNYAVYAFDWRRSLLESARWFEDFLRRFRAGVISRFGNDKTKNPLSNTTFICHSHGGLVAALFLQRVLGKSNVTADKVREWMEYVITVGTPFYANANHIKRYFNGIDAINIIHDAKKIVKIVSSMPGPYTFLFLDKDTFNDDVGRLELDSYPVVDAGNNNIEVDPYDSATLERYPKWVKADFLEQAKNERRIFRRKLPKPVIERVFHIRSGLKQTGVKWEWKKINMSNFDPKNDNMPIRKIKGPGDGTVPAWAARLAQVDLSQVYDLKKADSHLSLMEHEETLNVITRIIKNGECPRFMNVAGMKYIGVKKASRPSVDNFLLGIKDNRIKVSNIRATDNKIWRGLIEEINI